MRTKPGKGWKHAGGPCWDHVCGIRLHLSGLVRTQDGSIVSASRWPEPIYAGVFMRVCGGNRKRGLMVWALSVAERKERE